MWPKDNLESWVDIHQFIDEFPDTNYWIAWKRIARQIISDLEARNLNSLFRIGQSMHDIMISTLEHHRLSKEPRVILQIDVDKSSVRVAYAHWGLVYGEPESETICPADGAIATILDYLRRLWDETKPNVPIPEAIQPPLS